MSSSKIPFNRPSIIGRELVNIADAVERGQLAGDGYYTHACEKLICETFGAREALLTHSCTAALEMSAMLLNLKPGDEVILPSYTFVSTANAVVLRGATPVFVDIRPDTLNLDEERVAELITPKTRAIFAVHYAGVPAEINRLKEVVAGKDIAIVEDAAQALGSKYYDQYAGTLGELAAFSFHETKNIISGEGGALVVNKPDHIDRAAIIREKGTNRRNFFQGKVDKYTWMDIGSSFLPGELIAAYLFAQLQHSAEINSRRMHLWQIYNRELEGFEQRELLRRPYVPPHCTHNAHMYYIILPDARLRPGFIARMSELGIGTPFHYVPLHSAPAGKMYGKTPMPLPVTEDLSTRLVRLPLYHSLTEQRLSEVLDALQRFFRREAA